MAKVKRVYKCKDLRTMVGTTNISHYFHWKLHMYIAIAYYMYYMHALYVCICIHIAYVYFYWDISIFSPWNSMPCFAAYIFQSTNILEIFLCQPPFKLFWMDMSWMQPLRMDVSCSSVDGQGSFQFFFYYEFAVDTLVCDLFWIQLSVSLEQVVKNERTHAF